ncbi:uncharacterized protein LOC127131273 [Lathyrus oleraceus]|uniref:uncharacterized protein LOC127131273 n=1 Tax=Pisum sativum TaxID=3888 RepID=UPI0021CE8444|nr:uncharacterized protein LOC127131273 [Pisum sativum]
MMKVVWDTLVWCHDGDASVKKVKFQSLRKQYENLSRKNNEKVPDYNSREILITNEMKLCEETLSGESIIENVLRSLNPQFDYIVVAIEHYKDLSTMRVEELQSSPEAQALRLTERTSKREVEQTLRASFVKKDQKLSFSEAKKIHDCWSNKERKSEKENITRSSDDEHVLLMDSDSDSASLEDWWYMDTGSSNHLTGNKKWLVDFESMKRTKIRCVDDKYLNAEGVGNVIVILNNGKFALIHKFAL